MEAKNVETSTRDFLCTNQAKWHTEVTKFIEELEAQGYHIVGASPIEEVVVKVVGRRFKVERRDNNE